MNPTIGRVVYYLPSEADLESPGPGHGIDRGQPLAAVVAKVNLSKEDEVPDTADLVVFTNATLLFRPGITQGDGEGSWSWPQIIRQAESIATPPIPNTEPAGRQAPAEAPENGTTGGSESQT